MSMVYKLGDGPINYDWNPRYVSIEGTEIFYSPSPSDRDRKTINIYEGAVSNICKIKGKNFSICVNLPPPTNKSLFFAADTYDEAIIFRNQILKATLNNAELEESEEKGNKINANQNYYNNKPKISNMNEASKNEKKKLKFFSQNVTDEFLTKLEQLKNEILFNENKFCSKFKKDLKISIPINYNKYEYSAYAKSCLYKILLVMFLLFFIHVVIQNYMFYPDRGFFKNIFSFIIEFSSILFFFKKIKNISYLNPFKISDKSKCDYIVKASTIIEGDRDELMNIISKASLRVEWDNFIKESKDVVVKNSKEEESKISSTAKEFNIKFTNPMNSLLSYLFSNNLLTEEYMNMDILKYVDNKNNYFIAFRHKNTHSVKNNFDDSNLFELFVLMPIKDIDEEKTLVLFITNFDLGEICKKSSKSKSIHIPYFYRQILKEERLDILSTLKEYVKVSNVNVKSEDIEINKNINTVNNKLITISKVVNTFTNRENRENREAHNKLLNEDLGVSNYMSSEVYMETVRSYKSEQDEEEINPESVITNGQRIPLEMRLPGYLRNPEGGVECRNYEELSTQDGIILEVMKRAGRQLLEGKNVVAVSLPVRIFEPRSTLTRIADTWGAGPLYFNKIATCINPVERMKLLIAFAISGMHTNLRQLKPFNPILGETFEAYWPDGSTIYEEHMSHHPPISRFLILSQNKSWKFHGFYEYVAKLKSLTGNAIGGQFKGPNVLELSNGDSLSFTFPNMNITGLMYGRRIMEWEGTMEFRDENNDISADLTFSQAPRFYQSFKEATDIFRGELKQGDKTVHKVFGSPLDKLLFDGQIFWELETVDIIKPVETKTCLPSDCRYRTDLIALAGRNIPLAEEEKLRLEVLQRADRSARQKNSKYKH